MKKQTKLPKHLQDCVNKYEAKCAAFGIDPNWHVKAYQKAEERGDDFNPIYGMIK